MQTSQLLSFVQVAGMDYLCRFQYSDGDLVYTLALYDPENSRSQISCQVQQNEVSERTKHVLYYALTQHHTYDNNLCMCDKRCHLLAPESK